MSKLFYYPDWLNAFEIEFPIRISKFYDFIHIAHVIVNQQKKKNQFNFINYIFKAFCGYVEFLFCSVFCVLLEEK